MAEQKKYYWLKLKRDFFKRHDIRIIEEMPNGKDYILFYLKMLLESIDHEGELRFSETIPYNEQMLSVITNTNVDIVKSAMKVFIDLNMIEILDDSTIYMAEVLKLTGSETKKAELMRRKRAKDKALKNGNNVTAVLPPVTKCYTEIEKETEKELDKEKDAEVENNGADAPDYSDPDNQLQFFNNSLILSNTQQDELIDLMGLEMFEEYCARLTIFIEENNARVKSHFETLKKWYNEDRKVKK